MVFVVDVKDAKVLESLARENGIQLTKYDYTSQAYYYENVIASLDNNYEARISSLSREEYDSLVSEIGELSMDNDWLNENFNEILADDIDSTLKKQFISWRLECKMSLHSSLFYD